MSKLFSSLFILCIFSLGTFAQSDLHNDILATWDKHVEMNAFLLKNIDSNYLSDKSSSGGRNVGEQFAHMHNVRLMWLSASAENLDKEIDATESLKKDYLKATLKASDALVSSVLEKALINNEKIGNMTPVRFLGYLIAHEAHSRGQIMLALKQSGHEMPPQVSYGIWEWQ